MSVLISTRNQCALSKSELSVVLCVLITFLTRLWYLVMSVHDMKYESWRSSRAVFGGSSRGRMRRMRISSMAADDMCACSLSDWMAWACGVRLRATTAAVRVNHIPNMFLVSGHVCA